jgi:hypothetical protein
LARLEAKMDANQTKAARLWEDIKSDQE